MKVLFARRLSALLLACCVSVLLPLTVIAQVATPSELYQSYYDKVASPSEAIRDQMQSDALIGSDRLNAQLLSDSAAPSGKLTLTGYYYDENGVELSKPIVVDNDSPNNQVISGNFHKLILYAYKNRGVLPKPGTYRVVFQLADGEGDFYGFIQGGRVSVSGAASNVVDKTAVVNSDAYNYGTYYQVATDVQIGYDTTYVAGVFPLQTGLTYAMNPRCAVWFEYTGNQAAVVSPDVSAGAGTAADATADNTAQIVEKQDGILSQIISTTQTIVNQLSAFWDQLAAQFTNLYNKMTQQHTEQMQSDQSTRDTIRQEEEESRNFIVNGIVNGLKTLFIPSDEYFKSYFDDLYAWFSDRFGFLSFPIDLLIRLVDLFAGASESDCVLTLPSFSVMDEQLWPDMSFNFTDFLESNFAFLLSAIRLVTSIGLIMAFVKLCEEKWNEVMRN